MAEKRYSLRINAKDKGVKIFDNIDEDNWRVLNLHFNNYDDAQFVRSKLIPVVALLNDLSEENEQLKSENQSWLKTASHFDNVAHKDRDYAKRMHKENEQLKKENKKLNCIIKQLEEKYEDKGFSLAYDMGECE